MPSASKYAPSEVIDFINLDDISNEGVEVNIESIKEIDIKSGFKAGEKGLLCHVKDKDGNQYSYMPNKLSVGNVIKFLGDDWSLWANRTILLTKQEISLRQGKIRKMAIIAENPVKEDEVKKPGSEKGSEAKAE